MVIRTKKPGQATVAIHRRAAVAQLRAEYLSAERIVEELPKRGMVRGDDGKPWSVSTINSDLKFLESQWTRYAVASTEGLKHEQEMTLRRVGQAAWAIFQDKKASHAMRLKALGEVRGAASQMARLMGLNAPELTEIDITANITASNQVDLANAPPAALEHLAEFYRLCDGADVLDVPCEEDDGDVDAG